MKKLLNRIVILTLVFSFCATTVLAVGFSDVPTGKWYTDSVEFCVDKGYVSGYKDGSFKPNNNITRAELAVILNQLLGLTSHGNNSFTDVENNKWYTDPVLNCANAGIITGYGNGRFGPFNYVTREQAAVIFCKAFNISNTYAPMIFRDYSSISSWARDSVASISEVNLMTGMGNNTFSPKTALTRAQVATIIYANSKRDLNVENMLSSMDAVYLNSSLFNPELLIDENRIIDLEKVNPDDFWHIIYSYFFGASGKKNWGTYPTRIQGSVMEVEEDLIEDIAFSIFQNFESIPDTVEHTLVEKDGNIYYFYGSNRGDSFTRLENYQKREDGTVVATIGVYTGNGIDGPQGRPVAEFILVPNSRVNTKNQVPLYYTIKSYKLL